MKKIQKGIVLITTMLLLSFIIMIASLLIVTGKNTLLLGSSYNEREKAQYAAESGLAYVQFCLAKNPNWIADEGSTLNALYNPGFSDFTVATVPQGSAPSNSRCIRGRLTKDGAEFYVAFWSGTTFNNSTSIRKDALGYPLKYYSSNALLATSDSTSRYFSGGTNRIFKGVPKGYAHIIVEGRCGSARKYAEAMLTTRDDVTGLACSMAAGDVSVNLTDDTSTFLVNAEGEQNCKIRSMGNISVNSVTSDMNPYQIANKGISYTGTGAASGKLTSVNGTSINTASASTSFGVSYDNTEDQTEYLKKAKVTWDKAAGDFVSGTTFTGNVPTQLNGGTWIYQNSAAAPGTYSLYWYPQSLNSTNASTFVTDHTADAVAYNNGSPATTLITGDTTKVTFRDNVAVADFDAAGTYLMTVKAPLGIADSGSSKDFAIAVYDYNSDKSVHIPSTTHRGSVLLSDSSSALITTDGGTADTSGNIYIDGELSGTGKVLSAGGLTFQGHSALQADNNSGGLSIYSRGTIQVDPVKGDNGLTSSVNNALQAAWNKIAGTGTGEFVTDTNKYNMLRDRLLETEITGTYGATFTENTRLIDVLTKKAGGGLGYDNDTANNLVDTLLAKNTYLGNNNGTSTDMTDHSFWDQSQKIQDKLDARVSSRIWNWYEDYNDGNTIRIGCGHNSWDYVTISFRGATPGDYTATNFTAGAGLITGGDDCGNASWRPKGIPAAEFSITAIKVYTAAELTAQGHTTTPVGNGGLVSFTYKGKNYQLEIGDNQWGFGKTTATTGNSDTIVMYQTSGNNYSPLIFNDTTLKGLIYTWEDLYGPNLQGGSFTIRGGIVAYGGDPSTTNTPGYNGKGRIRMNNAKTITFTYDPSYMGLLLGANGCSTKRVFQASF